MDLAVCLIGRNEGARLAALSQSLQPLREQGLNIYTVFVDSASTDGSLEIAQERFDLVVSLPPHDRLCAAAGRYWGTCQAAAPWILYLDGDMTLHPDFAAPIAETIRAGAWGSEAGLVGRCLHVDRNGNVYRETPRIRLREGPAPNFGGAVLLRTSAVIASGNWDPALFSFEELDLYARLKARGFRVRYLGVPMALHYAPCKSRLRKFRDNLIPAGSGLGRKFYGFGQLLAAHVRRGTLPGLVRAFPYPFVWWLALLLFISCLAAGAAVVGMLALAAGAVFVTVTRGAHSMVVYSLLLIQAALGLGRYRPAETPSPVAIWKRPGAPTTDATVA